jgi:HTH-type transcriptional regulator / antitoxin HigA
VKPGVPETKADYEVALGYVEALMDAEPGSPEEDELESLALLIEAYEQEHYPIDPPDPIEALKFRMEQQETGEREMKRCDEAR